MEVQNYAKKLQEWVPTVANSKEGIKWYAYGHDRMFRYDKHFSYRQVFKNNNSKEDNKKLTIVKQIPAKDWDAIDPTCFHTAGGIKPTDVKKEASGANYKIEFDLGPGQQLGWILPAGASPALPIEGINWVTYGIWDMEIYVNSIIEAAVKDLESHDKPDPAKGWLGRSYNYSEGI